MLTTSVRKTRVFWNKIDMVISIIVILTIYTLLKKPSNLKLIFICLTIVGIIILFTLDGKFGLKLEGIDDGNKALRIDPKRLKQNPYKEIYRYVNDTCYYNNIWRVSLSISFIICLMILPILSDDKVKYIPYAAICIFSVIYHGLKWKLCHSYFFIFKTVKHVCDHMANNPNKPYISLVFGEI